MSSEDLRPEHRSSFTVATNARAYHEIRIPGFYRGYQLWQVEDDVGAISIHINKNRARRERSLAARFAGGSIATRRPNDTRPRGLRNSSGLVAAPVIHDDAFGNQLPRHLRDYRTD